MPNTSTGLWRKSSRSNASNQCVEVMTHAAGVAVRDSKDTTGPMLAFGDADWSNFLAGIRAGQFDR